MKKKIERNERLYQYWLNHQNMSYESIGKVFHINRSRVFVILKEQKAIAYAEELERFNPENAFPSEEGCK